MANYKVHFYRKSGEGEQIIYLMSSIMGKRLKVSMGVKVSGEVWSPEIERCIESNEFKRDVNRLSKRTNKLLDFMFEKASFMINNIVRINDDISGDIRLVKLYLNEYNGIEIKEVKKQTLKPTEYFEKLIDTKAKEVNKRTATIISEGTVTNHRCVLKRFEAFLSKTFSNDSFELFDKRFNILFTDYLMNKGYTQNTISQTNSVLKIWLNQAVDDGLLTNTAYKDLVTKNETKIKVYLTEDEVKRLYEFDFTQYPPSVINITEKKHLDECRDLFIMGTQLGLRLSDLNRLNYANFDFTAIKPFVTVKQQKTSEVVKIPLSTIAVNLYEKYKGKFPILKDRSAFQRRIQKACKLSEINEIINVDVVRGGKKIVESHPKYELITSHTARRTFATLLYMRCHNSRLVMSFTGHKTEESFATYINLTKDDFVDLGSEYFD